MVLMQNGNAGLANDADRFKATQAAVTVVYAVHINHGHFVRGVSTVFCLSFAATLHGASCCQE